MKNSYILETQIDAKYSSLLGYDKKEIDNPDKYHPSRLWYLDRMRKIICIIRENFLSPEITKIGDFACAQANIGLSLAELGYRVTAVDINQIFIEYSKKKYERGSIEWIIGNVDDINLPLHQLDALIMGEVVEHCAYPEEILEHVTKYVKPSGLIIITTPNGERVGNKLPTFNDVRSKETREKFVQKQFRPSGKDHLFLFKLKELKEIIPTNAKLVEDGYLGGTVLINKYSYHFLRLFPLKFVESLNRRLSRVPLINKKTYINIYAVLQVS